MTNDSSEEDSFAGVFEAGFAVAFALAVLILAIVLFRLSVRLRRDGRRPRLRQRITSRRTHIVIAVVAAIVFIPVIVLSGLAKAMVTSAPFLLAASFSSGGDYDMRAELAAYFEDASLGNLRVLLEGLLSLKQRG